MATVARKPAVKAPPVDSETPAPSETLPKAAKSAPTLTAPALRRSTLEPGDRGEIVREIQERLTALGYMDGKINGLYGYATVRAVRRAQGDYGMRPSGVVDTTLLEALYA